MLQKKVMPKLIGTVMLLSVGGILYFGFLRVQAYDLSHAYAGSPPSSGQSSGVVSLSGVVMARQQIPAEQKRSGGPNGLALWGDMNQPSLRQLNSGDFAGVASYVEEHTQDAAQAANREADVVFEYTPGSVYKIYCQEGFLTDIRLQPGEEIQFIGGGDTVRWMVDKAPSYSGTAKQWHIYLKPLKSGLTTNLVITTNKHTYQLRAQSTYWYTPMIGWTYPQEEGAAFMRTPGPERQISGENIAVSAEKLNFRYKLSEKEGTYGWAPKMVFDDGEKTYIRMADTMSSAEAPALFIKEEKGKLALVNYRVHGNCYIVDRLFKEAEMRSGTRDVVTIRRVD